MAGSISMGAIVGIVIGALIVLAIGAYSVNNHIKKGREKERAKVRNAEAAMKRNSRENLVGRKTDRGYFAQQRSHSPAPSYVLAPSTSIVNWGDSKSSIHSASSSIVDLPRSHNGSIASLPAFPPAATMKPSPLRLNPSSASISGRVSPSGSVGGSYMPPLPSHRSFGGFSNPQASSGWVSPLDVHYSRPSTPQAVTSRPQPYLPRLQFPEETGKNALFVPTPAGSVMAANSEVASIVSSNTIAAREHAAPESVQAKPSMKSSFDFNFFDNEPPKPPSRGARGSTRSIFPAASNDERPTSRRSAKNFDLQSSCPLPPVPQTFGPPSPGLDPNLYSEHAIIRTSIVSKRSVSIYEPDSLLPGSMENKAHTRAHSRVVSSVYSAIESRSRSVSPSPRPPQSRSRSRSTSSKRAARSHSQSLSRTQDSIRHSRKVSLSNGKRRSRDRDQIHYDPTSHSRNRSGSVQGRSVDFDRPRESPFSNAHAIEKTHSATSSLSVSTAKTDILPRAFPKPPTTLGPGLAVQDQDRLSVATAASRRGRSASEASQTSMGFGDFYDAYYRQSVLAKRASITSLAAGKVSGEGLNLGFPPNKNGGDKLPRGRPPPLKLGGSGLAEVMEVASPMGVALERFPSRI